MDLVGLSFQNYKAFPERESVEIRPLTVLIGRNSSGKSAIARLPLLLAGALSERAEAPIELDVEGGDFGAQRATGPSSTHRSARSRGPCSAAPATRGGGRS
jgi:predicted ATPase